MTTVMLNKEERDALRTRLSAITNEAIKSAETEDGVVSIVKEWVLTLLAHADSADVEIARLAAEVKRETVGRERAEKGMEFYESGEWAI